MEMTIEKAHEILSNGLVNAPSEHEWCVAFIMAINTMRKYQKIQEIVNGWNRYRNGVSSSEGDSIYMQKISEVLKDGNN